jgi:hypothetical protein
MANFEGLSDSGGMHGDGVNDYFQGRLNGSILPGAWVDAETG